MGEQHEKARDRQVLLEMQEPVAIAELVMEQDGGGEAEPAQREGGGVGLIEAATARELANLRASGTKA